MRRAHLLAEQLRRLLNRLLPRLAAMSRALRAEPVSLLILALFCEALVLIIRSILLFLLAVLMCALAGTHTSPFENELALYLPLLWPLAALVFPFPSGSWWKHAEGGREPSQREQLAYQDSLELLGAHSRSPLILPRAWFVIDTPEPNAAVLGDTLMITRALLETDQLPAVLAHELGHLASTDGRLSAALNRIPMFRRPRIEVAAREQRSEPPPRFELLPVNREERTLWEIGAILLMLARGLLATIRFARGGYGLRLTQSLWGSCWRAREYEADSYAARLGQAEELAEFLENFALIHDQPIPFIWLTEHAHPPAELPIDRLRAHQDREDATPALPR